MPAIKADVGIVKKSFSSCVSENATTIAVCCSLFLHSTRQQRLWVQLL